MNPVTGALARIQHWLRCITPVGLTLLLAILPAVPLDMPPMRAVLPLFTLMAVFYWTIYRPDLLPAVAVFVIGIIQDFLSDGIPGLTAIVLLAAHGVVLNNRRVFLGKPFIMAWWGFMMVAAAATLFEWFAASLLSGRLVPLGPAMMQLLATLVMFPTMVWVLVRTHRRVLPQQ